MQYIGYLIKIFALALLFTYASCENEAPVPKLDFEFLQLGLDGLKVYELSIVNERLYAATNNGVYSKHIHADDDFIHLGLEGRNVVDFIVFSDQHILATTANRGAITDDFSLLETTNGGDSWDELDMFGEDGFEEPVHSLSVHPHQANVIYATGLRSVATSSDYGRSWELLWGEWGAFATGTSVAEVNPSKQTDLWYGGQGAIENGYLGVLRNESALHEWDNLVPNPTVAVEVMFDQRATQTIYVGFEGALMKTTNNGNTWKEVINGRRNGMRFFYGIDISTNRVNHVFAGGWLKGEDTQPLIINYSTNAGKTWRNKTFDAEQAGGILSMKVVSRPTHERIFVGLDRGGVYEITGTIDSD
ncbi:MAG: hypothetical protein KF803_12455 [Cyclobacteriaceae bacterium]|nr:hypothetical protein [Cyclobacteriaceae bacterium]